ncbi:hypothetical protein IMCC3088_54 [Aequoribacter fuscus]|uniref:Uncharacterized protein n=1 Tax=Aequoribacter fuscus TaxID=2518989 RepID=F3L5C3_9GAMM|nr:hypothetical protein IMCC3088_54 [Aequoribacter fuscus]
MGTSPEQWVCGQKDLLSGRFTPVWKDESSDLAPLIAR